ncbi:MAG TPA: amidase family protein, partial [Ktedonobacterales bacterium]|nr:amidase family protein [Ktedonobacterales bacterium]
VAEVTPPGWASAELQPAFTAMYAAAIATGVAYGAQVTGREPSEELVEPLTWAFYGLALSLNALDYSIARIQLQAYSRQLIAFFQDYDVLVTPTLAQRPLPIGAIDTCSSDPWGEFQKAADFTPFTPVFNVSGQPAISLPLFHGTDGLPIGMQFVGAPLGEGVLLSLATQLEAAHPWAARNPDRS